jgi:hypothetical protein
VGCDKIKDELNSNCLTPQLLSALESLARELGDKRAAARNGVRLRATYCDIGKKVNGLPGERRL